VIGDKESAAARVPPNIASGLPNAEFCAVGQVVSPQLAEQLLCITGGYPDNFTFNTAADVCACFGCMCGCTVTKDCVSGGDIVLVFFSVVMGAFSLGQAAPSLTALNNGRAAAGKIFAILNRTPLIDASSEAGLRPSAIKGRITLERVTFRYPTRPDAPVFEGVDLTIEAGQTVALVGGSGCGKSTVTQLVQRFYDPEAGSVKLDGVDLRELNVQWLRESIGLVGQEPVLFATSIAKNIAMGCSRGREPSIDEVHAAARAANAYDFIVALPDGFDTFVGEGGGALSGGQKQRIAIARAMIRNPSMYVSPWRARSGMVRAPAQRVFILLTLLALVFLSCSLARSQLDP
jgi:ABC-type multidrug transport system fused ATPase/permease subunit